MNSALFALWKREILRFVRQRSRWIGALATPLLFWIVVGAGLGGSFRDATGRTDVGYLGFLFPGAVALSVLFTAIFSTISVIEDRHQGFLQGVIVSPVSRVTIVLSKVCGGASLGLLQGMLFLAVGPFIGIAPTLARLMPLLGLLFLMAASLTSLGFYFAWKIDSTQGYHGVMNLVFMPMWALSGALFPGSSPVFRALMKINPLSYALEAFRALLTPAADPWGALGCATLALGAFLACFVWLSLRAVRASAVRS